MTGEALRDDPFLNEAGERASVLACPECWSVDGWDSSAKWCYDCSTEKPPVTAKLYTAPPAAERPHEAGCGCEATESAPTDTEEATDE